MKFIKMALMGGAAIAATSAAAHADDLDALKAQIEALNARVAAMEAAPSVPAGYNLLTVSEGPRVVTPGLTDTASQIAAMGNSATYISVLPTADAPASSTITWSGYARAGLVYNSGTTDIKVRTTKTTTSGAVTTVDTSNFEVSDDVEDTDVRARGQIRVTASTDTAVGEVGVDIRLRANFDGNGNGDIYSDVAWGYWSMTPELTFGGGYAGSLGNISYGYDGACTCYYTDNADVNFNPGDVTQFRLAYGSGPVSAAVALEDASLNSGFVGDTGAAGTHGDKLGVSGELKYSGDIFNGEVAAVWRDRDDSDDAGWTDLWQVGAGMAFALGDMATLSIAGAFGEGPFETVAGSGSNDAGEITTAFPYNQSWWGVSGLLSANLNETIHAEIAAGYKNRDGDDFTYRSDGKSIDTGTYSSDGVDYDTWAVLGGIYYDPVPQLTIGVEAEYYTVSESGKLVSSTATYDIENEPDNFTLDLVSVWRF